MTDPTGSMRPDENTEPDEATGQTENRGVDESPAPTATEETMTTPTTSSPPEGDFFAEAGATQTAQAPETEPVPAAPHRPTLGDGPTVTYAGPQQPAPPKGPRMRSIAWGLVIALLGVVVIAVGLGVRLDLQLVFIGILAVAGLTLLVGSLFGSRSNR